MILRKTISYIVVFILSCGVKPCLGSRSIPFNILTASYGSTYRFDQVFRHTFSLDLWMVRATCISYKAQGLGLDMEYRDPNSFNLNGRLYKMFSRDLGVHAYVGLASCFSIDNERKNIAAGPMVGFMYANRYYRAGWNINLNYGYNFAMNKSKNNEFHPHHVSLTFGFSLFNAVYR